MTAIGTITYKNQLTIPSKIMNLINLNLSRKVVIYIKGSVLSIKPLKSNLDILAGSLHRKKQRVYTYSEEKRLTQKLVAQEVANE